MTHPTLRDRPTTLIIGAIETMPIIGSLKRFHAMDESTVCTVETQDKSGATRDARRRRNRHFPP